MRAAARASQSGECPAPFVQGRQHVWKPGAVGRPHAHAVRLSVAAVSSLANLATHLYGVLFFKAGFYGESTEATFQGSRILFQFSSRGLVATRKCEHACPVLGPHGCNAPESAARHLSARDIVLSCCRACTRAARASQDLAPQPRCNALKAGGKCLKVYHAPFEVYTGVLYTLYSV